jgi:hypothetical protein
VPPQVLDEVFAQLDDDYFRVFSVAEITTHVLLLAAVDEQHPVQIRVVSRSANRAEILVAAYDLFGEFSIITGLMTAYGLNIRDGQVFSYHRGPGRATLWGTTPGGLIVDVLPSSMLPSVPLTARRRPSSQPSSRPSFNSYAPGSCRRRAPA